MIGKRGVFYMTELEKMLEGKIYDPNVPELIAMRQKAHLSCLRYNQTTELDGAQRKEILDTLLPDRGEGTYLQGPIQFDFGTNIHVGLNFYANFNFVVLDIAPITIGDNVYFGPNCSLYAAMHPFIPKERNMYQSPKGYMTDKEYAKPITIGSDCWFGGNVTIIGGVSIGNGCVIGAGSVVTRDLPSGYLCAGNPCRPLRKITEEDSIYLKKELF